MLGVFFFFKQKTAYEMRISDWSSDVCSSDLLSSISGDQMGIFRSVFHGGRLGQPILGLDNRFWVESRHSPSGRREGARGWAGEIGRASCRERVCQYV